AAAMILFGPAIPAQPAASAQGTIVANVMADSAGAKAGLLPRDPLLAWKRGDKGGDLRRACEVALLETEEGTAAGLTLSGRREQNAMSWSLPAAPWGIVLAPQSSPEMLGAYRTGGALFNTAKFVEAGAQWERGAGNASAAAAAWL